VSRILVLDDDQGILDALTEVLQITGYEVKTITSAENIFDDIRHYQPDLILVDFLLLDANGGEICAQLKAHSATAKIPIILLSGFCSIHEMHSIYGCDAYVSKPFDLDILLKEIKKHLNTTSV
jgi:DNA-binding response OmpR family regulator